MPVSRWGVAPSCLPLKGLTPPTPPIAPPPFQLCSRVVDDAPSGHFKPLLRRIWGRVAPKDVEDPPARPLETRALLFAFASLSALLLARGRFGPRGWPAAPALAFHGQLAPLFPPPPDLPRVVGLSGLDPAALGDALQVMLGKEVGKGGLDWKLVRMTALHVLLGGMRCANTAEARILRG